MLLVCRNLQPTKNLGDLMSSFTWDKLAKGWTCTDVGLVLLQLQAQERPMSSPELVPVNAGLQAGMPRTLLCAYPIQHNSAAPSTCECSLGCGVLVPSHQPLNIVFHKWLQRIG